MMKLCKIKPYIKTSLGIAFGVTRVKVKVTVVENRKSGFRSITWVWNEIWSWNLIYSLIMTRPRLVLLMGSLGSRSLWLKIEKWFPFNYFSLEWDMVMKLHILHTNDKTSLGIAFRVTQVKVNMAKNRKMVFVQYLTLEWDMVMKLHLLHANEKTSLPIAFRVTQVNVKVTVPKNRKMVSVQ